MIISASVHVQRSCNAQNLTSGTVVAANVHAPRSETVRNHIPGMAKHVNVPVEGS